MAILSGRYGKVSYDPTGGTTLTDIISINGWKLSEKIEYEDVTTYGKTNRVYVPGMMDISGSLSGFWDSADRTLWKAAVATTPGKLQLIPNNNEPTFLWSGLAYLDAEIDCTLQAPKVTSEFKAAGSWTTPTAP
jgi:hypothetical protein